VFEKQPVELKGNIIVEKTKPAIFYSSLNATSVSSSECLNLATFYPIFQFPPLFFHLRTGNPNSWTIADVGKWLVSIEMSKHVAAFKDDEINGKCLRHVDDETLRLILVQLPAHRKNLLALIAEMFGPSTKFDIVLLLSWSLRCQSRILIGVIAHWSVSSRLKSLIVHLDRL
jgi:hypothetical protein